MRKEIGVTKEEIYKVAGISRQGYYRKKSINKKQEEREKLIIEAVRKVRENHKNMGSRSLYYATGITEIGITKFERLMSEKGMTVSKKKKWLKTTIPLKHQYPNLLNGLEVRDINEVIVGDITYYYTRGKRYYIFVLKDVYSNRIVGLSGSNHMYAEEVIEAFYQLVATRSKEQLRGTIHHTDAGSQYLSEIYKTEIKRMGMRISIAKNCLENGSAEQLNGVIKNDYLDNYTIRNVRELQKALIEIKELINTEKPVKRLGYRTPVEFENYIKQIPKEERPKVVLYDFTQKQK